MNISLISLSLSHSLALVLILKFRSLHSYGFYLQKFYVNGTNCDDHDSP